MLSFERPIGLWTSHGLCWRIRPVIVSIHQHFYFPAMDSLHGLRPALCALFLFGSVLGSTLLAILNTGGIQNTTNDVVPHTRQIFHTSTSDQHNGVFLQIVAFARDIGGDLKSIG